MKNIRRSLNKDKIGQPTPTYSTLPTSGFPSVRQQQRPVSVRPTQAPAPPKRVIKAVAPYKSQSPKELSFSEGDFFHVVSDDGGDEWFDAANPMTGARGLVPASHFQVLGRNVRETAQQQGGVKKPQPSPGGAYGAGPAAFRQQQQQPPQSAPPGGQPTFAPQSSQMTQHAYTPSGPTSAPAAQPQFASSQPPPPSDANGRSSRPTSQPAPKSQPLYGIVQYDFVAERTDELDAKRGEPIIVIAQSNHEWFVAKPIGRLGGPGLIPVAFVEIQDMTTGKPVENVEELIRSAVVPKVEEWKKMTADYKSASIPLGRFDFADPAAATSPPTGKGSPATVASSSGHQGGGSNGARQSSGQLSNPPHGGGYPYDAQSPAMSGEESDLYGEENRRYSYSAERERYGLVTSASVESFHQEEGSFWFHLRAFFSTGASLVLYRLYQDFYEFQITLMEEFPVEAGRIPPGGEGSGRPLERILPMMPGPTDFEDEVLCAQRVQDLSIYLADLCTLPERLRASAIMYDFFVPRPGDVEVVVGNGNGKLDAGDGRQSIDGQYGELVDYLDQMDGGERRDMPDMGGLSLNGGGQDDGYGAYQPSQERQSGGYSDQRRSQQYSGGDDHGHQQSYQNAYPQSMQQHQAPEPPMGNANQNVPFVKIKIFHRNTDDLIAIRVPPTVSHASLLEKVRERLGNDVVNLRYREEVGSQSGPAGGGVIMAGGARLIGIENDLDLERKRKPQKDVDGRPFKRKGRVLTALRDKSAAGVTSELALVASTSTTAKLVNQELGWALGHHLVNCSRGPITKQGSPPFVDVSDAYSRFKTEGARGSTFDTREEILFSTLAALGARRTNHTAVVGPQALVPAHTLDGIAGLQLGAEREGACRALMKRAVDLAVDSNLLLDTSAKGLEVAEVLRVVLLAVNPRHPFNHSLASHFHSHNSATATLSEYGDENSDAAGLDVLEYDALVAVLLRRAPTISNAEMKDVYGWRPEMVQNAVGVFMLLREIPDDRLTVPSRVLSVYCLRGISALQRTSTAELLSSIPKLLRLYTRLWTHFDAVAAALISLLKTQYLSFIPSLSGRAPGVISIGPHFFLKPFIASMHETLFSASAEANHSRALALSVLDLVPNWVNLVVQAARNHERGKGRYAKVGIDWAMLETLRESLQLASIVFYRSAKQEQALSAALGDVGVLQRRTGESEREEARNGLDILSSYRLLNPTREPEPEVVASQVVERTLEAL
ncbi:bud emergence protein 1 [Pseudohyphozyma bogoriensis]|nr:bud emergence protein 1 [Pseudohyphozyma bogoriensis]